ncbi:fatty acid elongase 3-like [Silene latifolia]|uniref:fatty acid elongase 3-like n=1 Tax=Silene latifolia TaxID=37657 RepID=UPI003D7816ED
MQSIKYYLADHPTILNFRWGPTQTWFSTWSFLIYTLTIYTTLSLFLHYTLSLLLPNRRRFRFPLGPIPSLHTLLICLTSTIIFAGTLISATAEIHDNSRWLWRRSHLRTTPVRWLLCFPPGTRPSGRVFFWSYAFYLSRLFLHLPRTFLKILRRRPVTFFHVMNQSCMLLTSFLWLEFSQSFQVLAILLLTFLYAVVYGYKFWVGVGLPRAKFPFVVNCQVVLLACNLVCHAGVMLLHYLSVNRGGCNGIGAWGFNSACNGLILILFFKDYKNRIARSLMDDDYSSHYSRMDSREIFTIEKRRKD